MWRLFKKQEISRCEREYTMEAQQKETEWSCSDMSKIRILQGGTESTTMVVEGHVEEFGV
jgi:hypothetical protein